MQLLLINAPSQQPSGQQHNTQTQRAINGTQKSKRMLDFQASSAV
jgi:hypothetical protein